MASLREIRNKIKSVRQTQKVTKAMKMIAAARLKKAQASLVSSRPYAYKVEELIRGLSARLEEVGSELPELMLSRPEAKDRALVVFSSDRGLCGSYNVAAMRLALDYYKQTLSAGGKVHFFVVGKKGRDILARLGFPIVREYLHWMRRPSYSQAELLAKELLSFWRENINIGGADILFTHFHSLLRQKPEIAALLPVKSRGAQAPAFDFIYEPTRQEILKELLPRYVSIQISRMMFEAYTSEQASRMNVMENATRNAGELIEGLTLEGNKVRQAGITREILEVVSGAEALAT